jgi:short-subunit dehydrogenase
MDYARGRLSTGIEDAKKKNIISTSPANMPQFRSTNVSPQVVTITGASSGIGCALALHYARNGACLRLLARNVSRLREVVVQCQAQGADVKYQTIDVRDRVAMAQWLCEIDQIQPIDLVIANAGISNGTPDKRGRNNYDGDYEVADTNIFGALNTILPLLPAMMARRRGQLAFMSSIGGMVPVASAAMYSASKAAVLSYGLALRASLEDFDLKVSVICPGFVKSPMARRHIGWKPFEISTEQAAKLIVRGLNRNRALIAFPTSLVICARMAALLPEPIQRFVMRRF